MLSHRELMATICTFPSSNFCKGNVPVSRLSVLMKSVTLISGKFLTMGNFPP